MPPANILSPFTWQDWVAIAGVLFGLVSLIAYLDQRRSARATATLTKWASLNLDKSISEDHIKALLEQKAVMEEQISKKIPEMARTAVLQEEAQLHEKAVAEHFAAWQLINRELQSESRRSMLEPKLQQAILDLIIPRYLRLDRRERLRNRVIALSVGLAASSAVMPFPLNTALAVVLALVLLYTGALLYAVNEDAARAFKILKPCFHFSYLVVALIVATIGLLLILYSNQSSVNSYFGRVLIFFGVLLGGVYFFIRGRIDEYVKQLCKLPTLW